MEYVTVSRFFLAEKVSFEYVKKFGVDNRHFKAFMIKDGQSFNSVGFNLGHRLEGYEAGKEYFDVVYYPEKVELRGEEFIQLKIRDFKKI